MDPEKLLAGLKKLLGSMSTMQVVSLGLVLLSIVAVLGFSSYWINKPEMALLADGLDRESANTIVAKLKTAKVKYELEDGGKAIRVESDKVDELRLQVASEGFSSAGHIGFEIFDKTSFGTTDTQERTNFQRALQGELERTIATIGEVASARVLLTMPKETLFSEQAQPAKASVALRLKTNRPLAEATVRGIAGLVSHSVESLRPEAVMIVDNYGHVLSRSEEGGGAATGLQLDKQQQVEKDLNAKLVTLLEPVVGVGRVRVNVAARLKGDAEEETEERWDPTTVVRSRQTNTEADSKTSAGQGGLTGARANLPEGASAAAPPTSPAPQMNGSSRNSETTNYEVSKLTRHRLSPQGQLARLSVAVIVDDARPAVAPVAPGATPPPPVKGTPRKPEEIQQIQKIVSAAMGFDQQRGDQLTVENISFELPADEVPPPPATLKQTVTEYSRQYGMSTFRTLAVLVLALAAIFGVVRPMSKRALAPPRELAAPPMTERIRSIQEMEAAPAGSAAAALPMDAAHRLPALSRQVARLANDEPEQLARIVRGWLAEEER